MKTIAEQIEEIQAEHDPKCELIWDDISIRLIGSCCTKECPTKKLPHIPAAIEQPIKVIHYDGSSLLEARIAKLEEALRFISVQVTPDEYEKECDEPLTADQLLEGIETIILKARAALEGK